MKLLIIIIAKNKNVIITGYMMVCYDLRPNKQSFEEEYGTLELGLNFRTKLPTNTKLLMYTVHVNHFFVLDEHGNYVPKMDKITM
jgi:hypothetical protein